MRGKRVLVSGGAGVIGRRLVSLLVSEGASVWVGDLKPRPSEFPRSVRYRQGDLSTLEAWEVQSFEPEVFFHLAATFERSTETYDFWGENAHHNVSLAHHLMTVLRGAPSLRRVVFASSYLIYDPKLYSFVERQERPRRLSEDDVIYPRNLTGAAKLLHEIELSFLQDFRGREHGFSSACARIYRVYGRDSRDVVSRWVRAVLRGEEITVYRPEGLFDYVFADDVAEGLVRLAKSEATGIVNLGRGRARRVAEVVTALASHFPAMRVREEPSSIPFEASEADMTLFRERVGPPPATDLEEGIAALIAFERTRLHAEPGRTAPSVLVTSASKKIPLLDAAARAVAKVSTEGEIWAADLDANCLARHAGYRFWQMPKSSELSVDQLIAYCKEHDIGLIVPTRDGELPTFARHRQALEEAGVFVCVSAEEAVLLCLDKLRFAEALRARGISAIATAEVPEALGLPDDARYVVKERMGAGSRNIGIGLGMDLARAHAQILESPIFQPFVEGSEFSIDVYVARNGKTVGAVARLRQVVVQGESQVTRTLHDPRLEALGARVAEALGVVGHAVLQVIVDPEGEAHVVECNPRFGGASTLSIAAGLDSLYWSLLEARGAAPEDLVFVRSQHNLVQVRVPSDRVFVSEERGS